MKVHDLFESRIYLITDKDDPLAKKNSIREEDLYGRTLMVGGGSPAALKAVQHRLINSGKIQYFNSPDPRHHSHQCGRRAGNLSGPRIPE